MTTFNVNFDPLLSTVNKIKDKENKENIIKEQMEKVYELLVNEWNNIYEKAGILEKFRCSRAVEGRYVKKMIHKSDLYTSTNCVNGVRFIIDILIYKDRVYTIIYSTELDRYIFNKKDSNVIFKFIKNILYKYGLLVDSSMTSHFNIKPYVYTHEELKENIEKTINEIIDKYPIVLQYN